MNHNPSVRAGAAQSTPIHHRPSRSLRALGSLALCLALSSVSLAQDEPVRDLEGNELGPQHAFDLAVGGQWSSNFGPQTSASAIGPGIYAVELNRLGTGWSERFLIGLPSNGASYTPALVLFHGYGQDPDDLLQLTDYFAKKRTMDFSFMRACVEKLVSEEPDLQGKPELDLVFYLGKDI